MIENLPPFRFRSHLQRLDPKRRITSLVISHKTLFIFLWITAFGSLYPWQRTTTIGSGVGPGKFTILGQTRSNQPLPNLRPKVFNLRDFGGIEDGVKLNTDVFERVVMSIMKLEKNTSAGQLNVPPGRWLTVPFNLTSHMTFSC